MSATNLTKNLKLSQFVASDKPSWLGDVNGDNKKIDDGYGVLAGEISKANDTASSAKSQSDANTQTLTNVNSELEDYGNRITALEAGGGTEQLEQRVNTLDSDVEALQTRADTFEEDITQNGTNITSLTERMTAVEGKAKTNEDNITSLTSTTNGLRESVQSASSTATQAKTNADLALNKANSADSKANTAQDTINTLSTDIANEKLNKWEFDYHSVTGFKAKLNALPIMVKGGVDNSTTPKTWNILPITFYITEAIYARGIIGYIPYPSSWTPYEATIGTSNQVINCETSDNIIYCYFENDSANNRLILKTTAQINGKTSLIFPTILFNIG